MSGATGQKRTTIGLTEARLELVDEVAAMMALLYGGRAPGRPQAIERGFKILRGQLRVALAEKERKKASR